MTLQDSIKLGEQFIAIYGDRMPPWTAGMALLWHEALALYEVGLVHRAILHWASGHLWPPTLHDFARHCCALADEQERDRQRQQAQQRPCRGRDAGAILADAARAAPGARQRWAQRHVELFEAGLGRPSTYEATAARCEQYAREDPDEAEAWVKAAAWWRAGAQGRPGIPG